MNVDNNGNILSVVVGDMVQVRTYEELFNRYGCLENGNIDCGKEVFTTQMVDYQGLKAKVTEVKKNSKGKPSGIVKLNGEFMENWDKFKFSLEMIKEPDEVRENGSERS